MQKTILAASVAAVLGISGAQATDLSHVSMKDAPAYAPVNSWTGFYIGLGGGLGAVNHDLKASASSTYYDRKEKANYTDTLGAELNGIGGEGGFGTVQVGYDRQLDQHFVAGVFFDYDFASIESKAGISYNDQSASISATLTDSWTVGGRLGYLVNANTLAYALGGYTEARFAMPAGLNGDYSGWTIGAGLETALGGSWYLKGEYRFTALDEKTLVAFGGEGESFKITNQPDVQSGRLVLSYKLSGAGNDSLK
jgi:outer membrane immunogenic protein